MKVEVLEKAFLHYAKIAYVFDLALVINDDRTEDKTFCLEEKELILANAKLIQEHRRLPDVKLETDEDIPNYLKRKENN